MRYRTTITTTTTTTTITTTATTTTNTTTANTTTTTTPTWFVSRAVLPAKLYSYWRMIASPSPEDNLADAGEQSPTERECINCLQ